MKEHCSHHAQSYESTTFGVRPKGGRRCGTGHAAGEIKFLREPARGLSGMAVSTPTGDRPRPPGGGLVSGDSPPDRVSLRAPAWR
jgi:hypothetical protein